MIYMNVHMSKPLKEWLAWAIDKQLQVISNVMLLRWRYTNYMGSALLDVKVHSSSLNIYFKQVDNKH